MRSRWRLHAIDFPAHYHLPIDTDEQPLVDQPMSKDLKHFEGGEPGAKIALPPGQHTLRLVLVDRNQVPFSPPVASETITVAPG